MKRALDRVDRLEKLDLHEIESLLDRSSGRPGAAKLRNAMAAWRPTYTNSELEDRFQELVRAAGIELPQVNVRIEGRDDSHEVDCLWEESGLVVQLDGFAWHRTRLDKERDAASDADLELAGYDVLRLTWDDVTKRGARTLERVRRRLSGSR